MFDGGYDVTVNLNIESGVEFFSSCGKQCCCGFFWGKF